MIFIKQNLAKAIKEAKDIKGAVVRYVADEKKLEIAGESLYLAFDGIEAEGELRDFTFPESALKFIEALEPGQVIIAIANGSMTIRQEKAKAKYMVPTGEAPRLPALGKGEQHTIDAAELRNMLNMVRYAVSDGDVRPALTGIRLRRKEDGRLSAEASDGYQVARVEALQTEAGRQCFDLLLPLIACNKLLGMAAGEAATLREDGRRAIFTGKGWKLCCSLIAAAPMDFNRAFEYGAQADVMEYDREDLLKMFGRAKITMEGAKEPIKLHFDGATMNVTLRGPACEFADEIISRRDTPITKSNLKIGFNLNHLYNALSRAQSDTVQLMVAEGTVPMTIRALCEEIGISFQALVLPVRLQEDAA